MLHSFRNELDEYICVCNVIVKCKYSFVSLWNSVIRLYIEGIVISEKWNCRSNNLLTLVFSHLKWKSLPPFSWLYCLVRQRLIWHLSHTPALSLSISWPIFRSGTHLGYFDVYFYFSFVFLFSMEIIDVEA